MCVCETEGEIERVCVQSHLSLPDRVDGVARDARAFLLAVVGEAGEGAVFAWPDGDLQVGVWVEEHALLQTHRLEVWVDGWKNKRYGYKAFSGFWERYV